MRLSKRISIAGLGGCVLFGFGFDARAQLFVYEGFEYDTAAPTRLGADLLHGQADDAGGSDVDAFGLGGAWNDISGAGASSDLFLATDSLAFGDLASLGNHVRSDTNQNNDNFARPISTSIGNGSGIWFSFLANKLQNNFSAAEGGLVIGNQQVNNPRILEDNASTGLAGFGIAPTTDGNNWTPYAWNGSLEYVGDASYGVPTDGSETNLLVGHIAYDAGTGGADIFTAYYYSLNAGSVVGGTLNPIASPIEVDVDQSQLDTLSLTRQVNVAYDEIRIGATLDDVVFKGGPPPEFTLRVDTTTGEMSMVLVEGEEVVFNAYQITSDADSLDPTGWSSMQDQDYEGNGPANGTGNGWEEAGGSDSASLAENFLLDNSTLLNGEQIDLGAAYDTAIDARDLVFIYRTDRNRIIEASVEYFTSAIPGDTDGDGDVDDSDLGTAFSNYTGPVGDVGKTAADGDVDGDGDVDDSDLGSAFSNYTGPIAANVPEPGSGVLSIIGGAAVVSRRRRHARARLIAK